MREWHLKSGDPLSLRFAADSRLTTTDYVDDQSWEVVFGKPDEPAQAFVTRYGGRAGYARLVPMFFVERRPVYETKDLAETPTLTAFAPNYARITSKLHPDLTVITELLVIDSQVVAGRFTFNNAGAAPVNVALSLFVQGVRLDEPIKVNVMALDDGKDALHFVNIGQLNPVVLMDSADTINRKGDERTSPKLTAKLTVPAGGSAAARWVHAGKEERSKSLRLAHTELYTTDWDTELARLEAANGKTPSFETGNADLDAMLAFSTHVLLRSVMSGTDKLPNPSFVTARIPSRGLSPRGDGLDHPWQWSGQSALAGYVVLPSLAAVDPARALSMFRNWLVTAAPDGWLDNKPGLGGQRERLLAVPVLAATAWKLYGFTEDRAFLAEVFPALVKFFARWFQNDQDVDGDGLPEWRSAHHSGYDLHPVFARHVRWAQNAEIRHTENADLGAMLVNEGYTLLKMAEALGETAEVEAIRARLATLETQIAALWQDASGGYVSRDRDTHATPSGSMLFRGKGDESFDTPATLSPVNRLILRIIGGTSKAPKVNVTVEGLDADGKAVNESLDGDDFEWTYGAGSCVSRYAYSKINYVRFSGLSRVFSIQIDTVDLTRQCLPSLLPLWGVPGKDHVAQLVAALTDPARYWRAFGVPICPANDPSFAANNENGSGGVWTPYTVMLIEGLLRHGNSAEAQTALRKMIDVRLKALRDGQAFREGYNSETGDGLGDPDDLLGILPPGLLMDAIGLKIVSTRMVWAGGVYLLDAPITVTANGVQVIRSADRTVVTFPTGHRAEVDGTHQLIEDPTPVEPPKAIVPASPVSVTSPAEPTPPPNPAEDTPRLSPLLVIRDPDSPTPPPDKAPDVSVIPVTVKRDDSIDIEVKSDDAGKSGAAPDDDAPSTGTVNIPVSGE